MSRRSLRINEQLRAELARLLRVEVTDPRIGLLVLTRVSVSADLSVARVHWSALERESLGADDSPPAPSPQVQAGLESAAPFLRRRLARLLPLPRVPELRFHHDPSLALGAQMIARINELGDDPPR